jgi:sugar-phosphatase
VIEDAPAGIQAAHAGGMKVIGITSTYPASALQADVVIQNLGQVKVKTNKAGQALVVDVESLP